MPPPIEPIQNAPPASSNILHGLWHYEWLFTMDLWYGRCLTFLFADRGVSHVQQNIDLFPIEHNKSHFILFRFIFLLSAELFKMAGGK